jgi:hypothetical protein
MSLSKFVVPALLALAACSTVPEPDSDAHACGGEEAVATASVSHALSAIDCTESANTGYDKGTAFSISVVTVDGKKVEVDTANAYYVMAQAAAASGVTLKVVSGFRTMAEQQYLYNCYVNCNCNNCNLAAKPGYSNHQSGHAVDLNTSSSGVDAWLDANAAKFGFKRTVPSEAWHWEWWGGGPGGGPCGKPAFAGQSLGAGGQSYPIASQAAVTLEVGQTVTGWVKLLNAGTEIWKPGSVWLAPMPRDAASPFVSPSWLAPHRVSSVASATAPGQIGEFALDLTGSVPGESLLELGWVAEGITWFADGPKGGGPKDGYFAVKVNVVPGAPPPPDPGSGGTAGSGGDTGGSGGASPASGGSAGASGAGATWNGAAGGSPAAGSGEPVAGAPDDNAALEGGCRLAALTPSSSHAGLWAALLALGIAARRRRSPVTECTRAAS